MLPPLLFFLVNSVISAQSKECEQIQAIVVVSAVSLAKRGVKEGKYPFF